MNEMIHDCVSSVENKITNEQKNYPLHDSLRDTKIEILIVHKNQCYERNIYLRRPVQEIYLLISSILTKAFVTGKPIKRKLKQKIS